MKKILSMILVGTLSASMLIGCNSNDLSLTQENMKDILVEQPTEESNDSEEIGMCYDCGRELPVSQMTYNGISYHCGCADGYSENYNSEVQPSEAHEEHTPQYDENGRQLTDFCAGCGQEFQLTELVAYGDTFYCDNCRYESYEPSTSEEHTTMNYWCEHCNKVTIFTFVEYGSKIRNNVPKPYSIFVCNECGDTVEFNSYSADWH